MIRRALLLAILFAVPAFAFASGKSAPRPVTIIDQGTFGIFQNGQLVATESFTIRQYPDSSVTSSELHSEAGRSSGKVEQSSELTLMPNGVLSRYEWKQLIPTRSSAIVEPAEQFLNMRTNADGKTSEQPFFLTPDAFILDDYFFSTREVLLWRYLSSACQPRPNGDGCDLVKQRIPILIPRRRTSGQVYLEFKGYDDTPLNGRPQHLRHFVMTSDGPEWHLWIDANHKLLRISIPDAATEVLRQDK